MNTQVNIQTIDRETGYCLAVEDAFAIIADLARPHLREAFIEFEERLHHMQRVRELNGFLAHAELEQKPPFRVLLNHRIYHFSTKMEAWGFANTWDGLLIPQRSSEH